MKMTLGIIDCFHLVCLVTFFSPFLYGELWRACDIPSSDYDFPVESTCTLLHIYPVLSALLCSPMSFVYLSPSLHCQYILTCYVYFLSGCSLLNFLSLISSLFPSATLLMCLSLSPPLFTSSTSLDICI